jgi:hypothetical protein
MERMRNQATAYQRLPVWMKLLSLASLLILAACTTQTNNPGAGSTPSSTPLSGTASPVDNTPAAIVTMRVVTGTPPTSEPGETSTPVLQPTTIAPSLPPGSGTTTMTPPAATAAPTGQELSLTLADEEKTVNLKVGQRFLLNLGADYDWTPLVADQNVVSRVVGILVIRGAQGVYEAHAPGTTILTASGSPTCLKSKPACAMPSRLYKVTLVVEP